MSSASSVKFAWPVRVIHWLSAGLILLAYLTSELMEAIEEGEYTGPNWHVFAGLALLALFLPRLLAKLTTRVPAIVPPPSRASVLPAKFVTLALLLFVLVQPVLGVLMVWSEGHALPVPFTGWELPPLIVLGKGAGHTVIGLHALAALWHHFGRRDNTLWRMF